MRKLLKVVNTLARVTSICAAALGAVVLIVTLVDVVTGKYLPAGSSRACIQGVRSSICMLTEDEMRQAAAVGAGLMLGGLVAAYVTSWLHRLLRPNDHSEI
jgi:hypothetical protein